MSSNGGASDRGRSSSTSDRGDRDHDGQHTTDHSRSTDNHQQREYSRDRGESRDSHRETTQEELPQEGGWGYHSSRDAENGEAAPSSSRNYLPMPKDEFSASQTSELEDSRIGTGDHSKCKSDGDTRSAEGEAGPSDTVKGVGLADGGGRGPGDSGGGRTTREQDNNIVVTRLQNPDGGGFMEKQHFNINRPPIKLQGSIFPLDHRPDLHVYQYTVDFVPEVAEDRAKMKLFLDLEAIWDICVFDGSSLYVRHKLASDSMRIHFIRETDKDKMQLIVKLVGELAPTDETYLKFFDILVRKCLQSMELEEMGRHFYDRTRAIRIEPHHLELWPGYKISMRKHDNDIILVVKITHRVLRLDNCLQVLSNLRGRFDDQRRIRDELVGTIVMTEYDKMMYRIDDVDWKITPNSTVDMRGQQVTFIEYFKKMYNVTIRDGNQPMLVSRPKKRDLQRGITAPIHLIPELCQMTGLTDEMKAYSNLMTTLHTQLHVDPVRKVEKLRDFMQRLKGINDLEDELRRWGLEFQHLRVDFEGQLIPRKHTHFEDEQHQVPIDRYD